MQIIVKHIILGFNIHDVTLSVKKLGLLLLHGYFKNQLCSLIIGSLFHNDNLVI